MTFQPLMCIGGCGYGLEWSGTKKVKGQNGYAIKDIRRQKAKVVWVCHIKEHKSGMGEWTQIGVLHIYMLLFEFLLYY